MSSLSTRRRWAAGLLAAYLGILGILVLTPLSFARIVAVLGDALNTALAGVLGGVLGPGGFGSGWVEFAANIVLFVPFGLLVVLLFRRFWWGVVAALALSAAIELVQAVIPSRTASLRDVVANVAGASVGAVIAWLIERRSRSRATTRAR